MSGPSPFVTRTSVDWCSTYCRATACSGNTSGCNAPAASTADEMACRRKSWFAASAKYGSSSSMFVECVDRAAEAAERVGPARLHPVVREGEIAELGEQLELVAVAARPDHVVADVGGLVVGREPHERGAARRASR